MMQKEELKQKAINALYEGLWELDGNRIELAREILEYPEVIAYFQCVPVGDVQLIKDASEVTGIWDMTGGVNPVEHIRQMRGDVQPQDLIGQFLKEHHILIREGEKDMKFEGQWIVQERIYAIGGSFHHVTIYSGDSLTEALKSLKGER
jgi:hypothetical protein